MKKKLLAIFLLAAMMLLAFAACSNEVAQQGYAFADKTYLYQGEGYGGGAFYIVLRSDGNFSYKEGNGTDYLASGTWVYENGVLSLTDTLNGSDRKIVNNFFYVDGNLWYLTENSSGFPYAKVSEGELFVFAYDNAPAPEITEE